MKRPNILFIMADQMAAPMLPIYAPSPIKMPNLSRLAEQAVVFDAAVNDFFSRFERIDALINAAGVID
ncbi:MAG: hypothetical protein ACLGJA_23470, partial [Gammaproteobacteria bacterium]